MDRPRALYYSMLRYQAENLMLLHENFDVSEVPSPCEDSDGVLAGIELCFAPLGHRFDDRKMGRCPNLKAIASNTTGVSHIDVAAAENRGIRVIALHDQQRFLESITPTAEHAWGLLLALMRRTPWSHAGVLRGNWDRRPFGSARMLSRMRLGVVGLGRLGRMVSRYGNAFGMEVRFFDPSVSMDGAFAKKTDSLIDLVGWAHVISVHVPATVETRHLFNRDILRAFKPGSWLVNTARGEVLDEEALLEVLESKHLAGAALDVLDGEFDPGFEVKDHPLVKYACRHDNLLLTPHIGGSTVDAWGETERGVIDRAIAFFEGIP